MDDHLVVGLHVGARIVLSQAAPIARSIPRDRCWTVSLCAQMSKATTPRAATMRSMMGCRVARNTRPRRGARVGQVEP